MGRVSDWWDRLTGRAKAAGSAAPRKSEPRDRAATGRDRLELADDAPKDRQPRTGRAGFDPYSSDAGYAKPHTWERVDHD